MPDRPSHLPPRYRDARPIGRGGMGEIFLARDDELGREVAVKVLSERFAQDEQLRERFRREALAAARLSSNPNIVTVFDVAEHDGRPLIVMEHLAGGSLEQRVRDAAPVEPGRALDWIEEAGTALDAAHEAGIVHRDVKPGNLLLDARGHVHVADFGVASAAGLDSFTQTGTILGTAGYLSPEQARGERATAASDLYALAVVAWELLTGRRPFEAATPTAEAAAHAAAPVPSIHAAEPALPPELDAVFARALAKDPADRYGSAAELVGALRRALHDAAGDTWPGTRRVLATPPRERGGRRVLPIALLLLALLAAGGALAAVLATRGGGRAAPPPVTRTITGPGITHTVTATPPPPPSTESTSTTSPVAQSGAQLNDAGYRQMQAGNYPAALGLLVPAVQQLQGTGQLAEAYADYNLAYTLYALGRCDSVLALLDRAQAVEGPKPAIDDLRRRAEQTCGKPGKGHGKHGQG